MLMMMKTKESEGLRPDWIYKRGDVYWADLNPFFGSEQGHSGIRVMSDRKKSWE